MSSMAIFRSPSEMSNPIIGCERCGKNHALDYPCKFIARLLGMSGEREAALLARLDEANREIARLQMELDATCNAEELRQARQKRDEYAKRAMAQTRAISRACRSAFAFIVTYMDAGLETTPAEEVPSEGFADVHSKPAPRLVDADVIDVEHESVRPKKLWAERSDEPIRKKQPVAQPMDGADMTEATLIEVQEKHGEGKKGHRLE